MTTPPDGHTWSGLVAMRTAYVVRLAADGTIVGTSSVGDVDVVNEEVHLGWTGYAPRTWGSAVNPATPLTQ